MIEIGVDKFAHILTSLLIFLIIFYVRKFIRKDKGLLRVVSYSIRDTFIIGILKELADFFGLGTPDIGDIIADSIGIILPIYIYYLLKESKRLENNDSIKYEKYLYDVLKQKIKNVYYNITFFSKLIFYRLLFKTKILQTVGNNKENYNFKKSLIELFLFIKYFLYFSTIWFINMFLIMTNIGVLAFKDSIKIVKKSFRYSFKFLN